MTCTVAATRSKTNCAPDLVGINILHARRHHADHDDGEVVRVRVRRNWDFMGLECTVIGVSDVPLEAGSVAIL